MSFVYTVNPNGGVIYKRAVEVPFSKSHLLERILSVENVRRAWKQVRANKGAPGIDSVTVEQFPGTFRELWLKIRSSLFEVPTPLLLFSGLKYRNQTEVNVLLVFQLCWIELFSKR